MLKSAFDRINDRKTDHTNLFVLDCFVFEDHRPNDENAQYYDKDSTNKKSNN